MVLAEPEHVEPELVGKLDLLHQLQHALPRTDARGEIGEGGDSEFHTSILAKMLARASKCAMRGPPAIAGPSPGEERGSDRLDGAGGRGAV